MSGKKGMRSELLRVLPAKYDESFASVLDGRCRIARTVRDPLQALVDDLGGESALSHQQKSLCRRAIWLEIVLESEELGIGVGRGVDGALHAQLLSGLVGVYRLLGIRRVARQAKLSDYIRKGEPTTTTNG